MQLATLNAQKLNNTRNAEVEVLFFPRSAKVGSEALMLLLRRMHKKNNFTVILNGPVNTNKRTRSPAGQSAQAEWVSNLESGTAFIEHCNWINFTAYGYPKPIFINLVRDPIERMISWYFYDRSSLKNAIYYHKFPNAKIPSEEWYKKDFNDCVRSGDPECQYVPFSMTDSEGNYKRQSLFFCGHSADCLPFDSPHAIQIAKHNVEKEYAVVGSWEDTNITLKVLEHYIPRFFANALQVFNSNNEAVRNKNKNKRKPKVDDDVKVMMRKNFTHEYEFYHFCKQRLYKQYIALGL